jgi:hypothetical protein
VDPSKGYKGITCFALEKEMGVVIAKKEKKVGSYFFSCLRDNRRFRLDYSRPDRLVFFRWFDSLVLRLHLLVC